MCISFVLHIPPGQSLGYMYGNIHRTQTSKDEKDHRKKKKNAFQKEENTRQWESDLTGKSSLSY